MADNSTQAGTDTIRDKDRAGVKTQIVGLDLGIGTATESLMAGVMPTRSSPATTGTVTSVAGSATSVTLLAANTSRAGAVIFNDSTVALAVALAATASLTAYTVSIPAQGIYELPAPGYTGIVSGIWATATGSARITELT